VREHRAVSTPAVVPFPRNFYVANAIELFERLAFYGAYVVLSLYLTSVVGLDDIAAGDVMALYAFFRLGPILGGVLADRIGFRIALVVSMITYAAGYAVMIFARDANAASAAIVLIGLAGALFKPIITGTVVRSAPKGRETEGFAIFYRIVNSGSVIGKSLTYVVRVFVDLRLVLVNAVVASIVGVGLAWLVFKEPARSADDTERPPPQTLGSVMRGVLTALKDWRFTGALLILSGFYFMSEQFYQTFPKYVTRVVDPDAPLEWVTLVNPLCIALFQSQITSRTTKLAPLAAMVAAMFVASASMFLMGSLPGLAGACGSFALFAFAEMIFAPRFYAYVARFAPKGQEATFMGLTVLPVALGGMFGGVVSGRMIAAYLPEGGPFDPFTIWSSYAGLGLACAVLMLAYERLASRGAAAHA
jgi:proton-dependent oligopeptide transporter, POT family